MAVLCRSPKVWSHSCALSSDKCHFLPYHSLPINEDVLRLVCVVMHGQYVMVTCTGGQLQSSPTGTLRLDNDANSFSHLVDVLFGWERVQKMVNNSTNTHSLTDQHFMSVEGKNGHISGLAVERIGCHLWSFLPGHSMPIDTRLLQQGTLPWLPESSRSTCLFCLAATLCSLIPP